MKSIILCEGSSDFTLLQYYMRKVYGWEYSNSHTINLDNIKRSATFGKKTDLMSIGGCGGCNRIIPALREVLESNTITTAGEQFDKVVIITDRDEIETEDKFIDDIKELCDEYRINLQDTLENDKWISAEYENGHGRNQLLQLLLLVIPFEETGAMETFLLNAIAQDDEYDAEIIRKSNQFVDAIDQEKRYLKKRRYITKAKFDVYFSVRTAAEQFVERQNILKSVPWEKYELIQNEFKKLKDLSSQ